MGAEEEIDKETCINNTFFENYSFVSGIICIFADYYQLRRLWQEQTTIWSSWLAASVAAFGQ
jgi:hypothetical protein